MKRYFPTLILVMLISFLGQSCAGKKSDTAATGAAGGGGSGDTDTSGLSESGAGAGAGGGTGSTAGFPTIYFDFDQYTLRSEDQSSLKGTSELLQKESNATLTIEGHCDERGSVEYNLALGERRAQSVKSYLQKLGIDAKRLNTISYGEERPASIGSSESAWTKNRRAELVKTR